MGIIDCMLLGIILVLVILAVRHMKKHKGGCGNCHKNCNDCANHKCVEKKT